MKYVESWEATWLFQGGDWDPERGSDWVRSWLNELETEQDPSLSFAVFPILRPGHDQKQQPQWPCRGELIPEEPGNELWVQKPETRLLADGDLLPGIGTWVDGWKEGDPSAIFLVMPLTQGFLWCFHPTCPSLGIQGHRSWTCPYPPASEQNGEN